MKRQQIPLLAALLMVLSVAAAAQAHRVIIFAWIEGKTVHTVSKFPGGDKVVDTPVVVYDGQNNRLLSGKTDEKGAFSFTIPKPAPLKIVLEAGTGHQAEWRLSEKEVRQALGKSGGETAQKPASGASVKEKVKASQTAAPGQATISGERAAGLDETQIRAIVEESLEKKLDKKMEPMMRMLADMQDPGPTLTEIFGGLGYILGLFGIAAYVASKKR